MMKNSIVMYAYIIIKLKIVIKYYHTALLHTLYPE